MGESSVHGLNGWMPTLIQIALKSSSPACPLFISSNAHNQNFLLLKIDLVLTNNFESIFSPLHMIWQEWGLEQPGWNQMCQGNHSASEHVRPARSGYGSPTFRHCQQRDPIDEAASVLPQHHHPIGVPERCTHLRVYHPTRQDVNTGAAGRPGCLCGLYPLVSTRVTRHLEWVPLFAYYFSILTYKRIDLHTYISFF